MYWSSPNECSTEIGSNNRATQPFSSPVKSFSATNPTNWGTKHTQTQQTTKASVCNLPQANAEVLDKWWDYLQIYNVKELPVTQAIIRRREHVVEVTMVAMDWDGQRKLRVMVFSSIPDSKIIMSLFIDFLVLTAYYHYPARVVSWRVYSEMNVLSLTFLYIIGAKWAHFHLYSVETFRPRWIFRYIRASYFRHALLVISKVENSCATLQDKYATFKGWR